ncbi:uncharacterized protein LOC144440448 [Glandiceps talaboti]
MSTDVGLSKRRKCVSTSTSSTESSRKKLRPRLKSTCPFRGSATTSGSDSGSSARRARGPSTSTWDTAHHRFLEFHLHKAKRIDDVRALDGVASLYSGRVTAKRSFLDKVVDRVLMILFGSTPTEHHDRLVLDPPKFIQDGVIELSTMQDWIENDQLLQYAMKLFDECETKFNFVSPTMVDSLALRDYIIENFKVKEVFAIGEVLLQIIKNDSSEFMLDTIVEKMIRLVIAEVCPLLRYEVSVREATKRQFEVCGSTVTSMTNVLLEYMRTTNPYPVMLSQNKSGMPEKESTGSSRPYKNPLVHKKISQVIGQVLGVADNSIFETDDYKIVYHISLMAKEMLVITRTQVAKSTLKEIKGPCLVNRKVMPSISKVAPSSSDVEPSPSDVEPSPFKLGPSSSDVEPSPSKVVPSSSDVEPGHSCVKLSPSHVVEESLHIGSHPFHLFINLYVPILILVKVCNFMNQPTVKDVPKTKKRKLKEMFKLPRTRKQHEATPTKKKKKS